MIVYSLSVMYAEYSKRVFPRYGTTSFLATVVLPQDHTRTQNTLAALNDSCGKTGHGAVLEGIHSEVYNFVALYFPPPPSTIICTYLMLLSCKRQSRGTNYGCHNWSFCAINGVNLCPLTNHLQSNTFVDTTPVDILCKLVSNYHI